MSKANRKISSEKLKTAFIIPTIATVAVIWFNSALPKPISGVQSTITEKIVENVVPAEIPFFDYVVSHIRKSAHIIEYGVLGAEMFFLNVVFSKKKLNGGLFYKIQKLWNMISVPLAIAVADESIQILSGRGPLIQDVLIDMAGAMGGAAVCLLGYLIGRKLFSAKS